MLVRCLAPLFLVLLLETGTSLLAQDTLVLVNGDRITGKIQRLEDRKLVVDSKLLGIVRVKWSDSRSIDSGASMSVLTRDGTRYQGQLSRNDNEIAISPRDSQVEFVEAGEIERIAPGGGLRGTGRLLDAAHGAVDIGFSMTRGNLDEIHSSLGANTEFNSARYRIRNRLDSLFARLDGARANSRHYLETQVDRYSRGGFSSFGLSAFERNERRQLDLRTLLGGGFGWRLVNTRRNEFAMKFGFAWTHEQYRNVEHRSAGEGLAGFGWKKTLFEDVKLETQLTVYPDASDYRQVRVEFDGTLRVPIVGRLTYSLRFFERYQTKPPPSVQRNDYGIVSGLGVKF